MSGKSKVDWNDKHTRAIIESRVLTLNEMAMLLGVSTFYLSRKRKAIGITERVYGNGLGRPTTNKERKQKYNAKIKVNGYLPLYKTKN